jgi:2-C-methyl-D-erythritol 4-phosphate cytidylyltransferase
MKKFAVIVAGGSGKRMATQVPKQFLPLQDKPILMHTLEAFHAYDAHLQLVLVLPEAQVDYWLELCETHQFSLPHTITFGGKETFPIAPPRI